MLLNEAYIHCEFSHNMLEFIISL